MLRIIQALETSDPFCPPAKVSRFTSLIQIFPVLFTSQKDINPFILKSNKYQNTIKKKIANEYQ